MVSKKLNLGSGLRPINGFINLDVNADNKPDIVRDITRGLPFDDNTVDEVLISHVLEHLNWEDFAFVMREMHRVCKQDAIVKIIVPHQSYPGAFDIDHKIVVTRRTLEVFTNRGACADMKHFHNGQYYVISECEERLNGPGEPQMFATLVVQK